MLATIDGTETKIVSLDVVEVVNETLESVGIYVSLEDIEDAILFATADEEQSFNDYPDFYDYFVPIVETAYHMNRE